VRLWLAILAGLQVVSGGSALMEVWDRKWVGLFVLVVAAAQAGTVVYMKTGSSRYQYKPLHSLPEEL
jgi:hypothetical protein